MEYVRYLGDALFCLKKSSMVIPVGPSGAVAKRPSQDSERTEELKELILRAGMDLKQETIAFIIHD